MFSLDTLYYGHASESYSTEYFEFNVLPSLTSAFGTTSDIVIVFMTLNRFELVQVRTETQKILSTYNISLYSYAKNDLYLSNTTFFLQKN